MAARGRPNFEAELDLSPHPGELARVRAFTRARLGLFGLDARTIRTATLLVDELASNAIRHARSDAHLRLAIDHALRVEVTDFSPRRPVFTGRPAVSGDSGRGFAIVDALSDGFGWSAPTDAGKTVWCELSL